MSINKVEMQDNLGNVYYPHTDASIVKFGSSDVGSALSEIVKKNSNFIPLAIESGYTYNANQNYYTKNFDNSIEVFFSISKTEGFTGNVWTTLAKLPVGFLPNAMIYGTGECNGYPTSIRVQVTGEIQFFVIGGGNIGYNNVRGYVRFYLTGGTN